MPLRFKSTNKMTRTNRRKAPVKKAGPRLRRFKSQAAAARYGRTPYAGRYATKPRVAHHKMIVSQEGLGQQTETKMGLGHLGKRDTRANLIKQIGSAPMTSDATCSAVCCMAPVIRSASRCSPP